MHGYCVYSYLGHWEEAYRDYQLALKLDYDDSVKEWLTDIKPKVRSQAPLRLVSQLEDEFLPVNTDTGYIQYIHVYCMTLNTLLESNGI